MDFLVTSSIMDVTVNLNVHRRFDQIDQIDQTSFIYSNMFSFILLYSEQTQAATRS